MYVITQSVTGCSVLISPAEYHDRLRELQGSFGMSVRIRDSAWITSRIPLQCLAVLIKKDNEVKGDSL